MTVSILIARIFGLCYMAVGGFFAFNRELFRQAIDEAFENTGVILYAGLFAFFVGITIILAHNVWVLDWTVLVTLIGWAALVKGTWMVFFPGAVLKMLRIYRENQALLTLHALFVLIFGGILTFFGFFAG